MPNSDHEDLKQPRYKMPDEPAPEREAHPEYTGDPDIDAMLADCIRTMSTKGKEYTGGSPDRLANFRGVAQDVGIPIEKAWYVFFNKHYRAVQAYIKNGCKTLSEPISGRIMDCVVYLLLFHKMTLELEKANEANRLGPLKCSACLNPNVTCKFHKLSTPSY